MMKENGSTMYCDAGDSRRVEWSAAPPSDDPGAGVDMDTVLTMEAEDTLAWTRPEAS